MFELRFPIGEVSRWAAQYPDAAAEDAFHFPIRERTIGLGYYSEADLRALCRWKSPRTQPKVASNPAEFVRAVSHTALTTDSERLRIEVLTLLAGVNWATASVLLHVAFENRYPILDFRALWSLGFDTPRYNALSYDFPFWSAYTVFCHGLAHQTDVSMRTLDRALWAYSKVHQKE